MKKALLIIGIILIVLGVLSLLIGGFYGYARFHTMDGSFELYEMQRKMMFIFLSAGVVFLAAGIVCLVVRCKMAV